MTATSSSRYPRLVALLRGPWPVLALLTCYLALALSAVRHKSAGFDEAIHLAGGHSYWKFNDYRLHAENGQWSQRWAALPGWLLGDEFPSTDTPEWQTSDMWRTADIFLYDLKNDPDAMLFGGRVMIGLLSVGLGLFVYLWSRQLFGWPGGLISLTLYALSPTMLSFGVLITSDAGVTLCFLAALWALWTVLHRVTPLSVAASCAALAALSLAKFSGLLIVPMALALLALRLLNPQPLILTFGRPREISGRWRQLAVFVAVMLVQIAFVVAVIWASFGFRYSMLSPNAAETDKLTQTLDSLLEDGSATDKVVRLCSEHHWLPEGYLWGLACMLQSAISRCGFLDGEFSYHGRWMFFPTCVELKTPLGMFAVLAAAAVAGWYYRGRSRGDVGPATTPWHTGRLYAIAPLLVLLIVYWYFALTTNLNIGHRHLLPTYPPLFVLAGAAGLWMQSVATKAPLPIAKRDPKSNAGRGRDPVPLLVFVMRCVVGGGLLAAAFAAVWSWPNYLAYFNILRGGPRHAYRHLVDSSLDWGQELPALKRWLDEHPQDTRDPKRLYFSYFGWSRPDHYGIKAELLPWFHDRMPARRPPPLRPGTYLISATMLQCVYTDCRGRWCELYEDVYQQYRKAVEAFERASGRPGEVEKLIAGTGLQYWADLFYAFEQLRFSRLCSFLREREPDDQIGNSILIYRLSEDDLRRALDGPPVELLAKPQTDD